MTKVPKTASSEHLKGSMKEAIGKLTGNGRVEAEGRRQKREATPPKADKPRAD